MVSSKRSLERPSSVAFFRTVLAGLDFLTGTLRFGKARRRSRGAIRRYSSGIADENWWENTHLQRQFNSGATYLRMLSITWAL